MASAATATTCPPSPSAGSDSSAGKLLALGRSNIVAANDGNKRHIPAAPREPAHSPLSQRNDLWRYRPDDHQHPRRPVTRSYTEPLRHNRRHERAVRWTPPSSPSSLDHRRPVRARPAAQADRGLRPGDATGGTWSSMPWIRSVVVRAVAGAGRISLHLQAGSATAATGEPASPSRQVEPEPSRAP
jgi:hypothetical protein